MFFFSFLNSFTCSCTLSIMLTWAVKDITRKYWDNVSRLAVFLCVYTHRTILLTLIFVFYVCCLIDLQFCRVNLPKKTSIVYWSLLKWSINLYDQPILLTLIFVFYVCCLIDLQFCRVDLPKKTSIVYWSLLKFS